MKNGMTRRSFFGLSLTGLLAAFAAKVFGAEQTAPKRIDFENHLSNWKKVGAFQAKFYGNRLDSWIDITYGLDRKTGKPHTQRLFVEAGEEYVVWMDMKAAPDFDEQNPFRLEKV